MYLASNNIPYRDRVALPAHGLWTVCAISGPIALCARTLFGKYSLLFSQIGNQALRGPKPGPNKEGSTRGPRSPRLVVREEWTQTPTTGTAHRLFLPCLQRA
jgi:hypothetical protein